jgi:hypothetical protein
VEDKSSKIQELIQAINKPKSDKLIVQDHLQGTVADSLEGEI